MSAQARPPSWEAAYKAWQRWMVQEPDRMQNAIERRACDTETDDRLNLHADWASAYVAGYLAGQRAARKEKRDA